MKRYILYLMILVTALLNGCSKEQTIKTGTYAQVNIAIKRFFDLPPTLDIYFNDKKVGNIDQQGIDYFNTLITADGSPVKLTIKQHEGDVKLLETTFTPSKYNGFTIVVDKSLGITEFYIAPPVSDVDADHIRMKLFHRVVVNGVPHNKVNFKFYTRLDFSGDFNDTPFELKNAEAGKLSESIDLPVQPDGTFYYIKTYDAETGELLLDLSPDYADGSILMDTRVGGKSYLVNVQTDDYPPYGAFYNLLKYVEL